MDDIRTSGFITRTVSRRSALRLITLTAGATLLAACGGGEAALSTAPSPSQAPASVAASPAASAASSVAPSSAAPASAAASTAAPTSASAAAAASPAGQPKPGGNVTTGQVGDLITTDGAYYSPVTNNTTGQVCDELIDYDDNLKVIPRLAESWDLSPDNKSITLNLRKGVTFHSGRDFTSDDVKYNILRVRDPKNPYTYAPRIGSAWWDTVDTPDKYTVVLKSSQSRPGVFDFLQYLRIVDKDIQEGPNAKTQLGGTGPYKFTEWVPGDHILFTKNPNYWEKGIPYLDSFRVNIFRDQQSMVAALEAGSIDIADLIAIPDATRLKTNPKFKVYENHSIGQFFYTNVNAALPPTDNKLLRQAINFSINRKRFADTVLQGFAGGPINLPWAPSSPAYDAAKNNTYTYNLDKAKSLLQQSGLTNVEFDIAWATAGYSAEYQQLAQILQADLASIGIKTNLKPMDPPAFTAAGTVTPADPKPKFNGMRISAGAFAQLYEAASEFVISPGFGYTVNSSGYYDDNFKNLAIQASGEPDAAKRKALYSQINDILLDASYSMPIVAYTNIVGMKSNVQGLAYEIQTDWTIRNTWLS